MLAEPTNERMNEAVTPHDATWCRITTCRDVKCRKDGLYHHFNSAALNTCVCVCRGDRGRGRGGRFGSRGGMVQGWVAPPSSVVYSALDVRLLLIHVNGWNHFVTSYFNQQMLKVYWKCSNVLKEHRPLPSSSSHHYWDSHPTFFGILIYAKYLTLFCLHQMISTMKTHPYHWKYTMIFSLRVTDSIQYCASGGLLLGRAP